MISISNITDLQKIGNDPGYLLSDDYELSGNIDASATVGWNGGLGFDPIGDGVTPFTGTFDGKGFIVSNLTINRPLESYIGLFGGINAGSIQNVTVTGTFVGMMFVGCLCGATWGGATVDTCVSSGSVTGTHGVGGLIGGAWTGSVVTDCSANTTVVNTGMGSGGLIGDSAEITVSNCSSSGTIDGRSETGGLIGSIRTSGTIDNCHSDAVINCPNYGFSTGGLIGDAINLTSPINISNCYSTGSVQAAGDDVGGFIGYASGTVANKVIISNCYSTGNVVTTGPAWYWGAGGFTSYMWYVTISKCYSTGNVTSVYEYVGGFGAYIYDTTITNAYSQGNVSASDYAGGFAGELWGNTVTNCYSSGAVVCPLNVGGFTSSYGGVSATTSCYWDTDTSGQATSAGPEVGKTTVLMKQQATFISWPFGTIWCIDENNSYPIFIILIGNIVDLQKIGNDVAYPLNGCYGLSGNIDASATVGWNGGLGFDPIGSFVSPFTGTFDGKGFAITSLTINRPLEDFAAVFAHCSGASISNTTINNCTITGDDDIAGLIALVTNSTVSNCHSNGTIAGNDTIGGLLAFCQTSSIVSGCTSAGSVTGTGFYAGGLIGVIDASSVTLSSSAAIVHADREYVAGLIASTNHDATITNCFATGSVTAVDGYAAGFVSITDNRCIIINCYATGNISCPGTFVANGFVNFIRDSDVTDCYATGDILCERWAAGFVGLVRNFLIAESIAITRCYATGQVVGDNGYAGGFAGTIEGPNITIIDCYATGNVSSTDYGIGGFAGEVSEASISNSYSTGNVDTTDCYWGGGGFIGDLYGGANISKCYSEGNIVAIGAGNTGHGGFVGAIGENTTSIENCYAWGDVSGDDSVGGFAGYTWDPIAITNAYSIGLVVGSTNVGGFIGTYDAGTITSSYWDTDTSGQATSAGPEVGKTTVLMKQQATFISWPFGTIWCIDENNSYPIFIILIGNIVDLQKIGNDVAYPLNGCYGLSGNIDASATVGWNGGLGFDPIGTNLTPFTGTFDGKGYSITDLTINRPLEYYIGLFAHASGSAIQNVTITGTFTGDDYVGGLAGYLTSCTISNCVMTTTASGDRSIGGMVGQTFNTTVSNCSASSTITAGNYGSGGLVGRAQGGSFQYCSTSGTVTSTDSAAAGLIGVPITNITISNCNSSVDVICNTTAGGLLGDAYATAFISDCYATGSVTATGTGMNLGGFVATFINGGTADRCYATGNVVANGLTDNVMGGFAGSIRDVTITDCYATGNITGAFYGIAGFTGTGDTATLYDCYATGNVTASDGDAVGGFIGDCDTCDIQKCYAEGNVSSNWYAGGFVGWLYDSTIINNYAWGSVTCINDGAGGFSADSWNNTITNCYSIGAPSGAGDVGGFTGVDWGATTATSCYWDTNTSGTLISAVGTGKNTVLMKQQATFIGWDFITPVWYINEGVGYPVFTPFPPPPPPSGAVMSTLTINGTLIQDGNVTCDGDITVTSSGIVLPYASLYYSRALFSCSSQRYVSCTGKSRKIESLYGDILIEGYIDGEGRGFEPHKGPGCNSALIDNQHHPIPGYGATHAGTGSVTADPGTIDYYTEEIEVSGEEMDQKWFLLEAAPIDGNVAVNPIHGPPQHYPNDFSLEWNKLSWAQKPMEAVVILGEKFRVIYIGTTEQIVPEAQRPYGSFASPLSLGSGSALTYGGGGIWIYAPNGAITVNGRINMNGQTGSPVAETGGGAGGSVWLNAWDIAGSGIITAMGGSASYPFAGGGGGGYVSIWYEGHNTFTGTYSVEGMTGGSEGRLYVYKIEPFFEEKFTGTIWNTKWWETVREPVILNNNVLFNTTDDTRSPAVQSLFSLSGDIKADIDYRPFGTEAGFYSNHFLLYMDDRNWAGIARKNGYMFGTFSVDGVMSQGGLPADNTDVTMRILKNDSTFTFQYFDATSTPITVHSSVIPEFQASKFKVRLGVDKLAHADATSIITEHISPTTTDLLNKSITLSANPYDGTNVAMNLVHGPSQVGVSSFEGEYFNIDYYVSNRDVCWDRTSMEHMFPGALTVDNFVLDATDITNQFVNLSLYPYPDYEVAVNITTGPPQYYGEDFRVYRKTLSWDTMGLADHVITGDTLTVIYWGSPTHLGESLEEILTQDDILRVIYRTDTSNNDVTGVFDSFRLFRGTLFDAESTEPVLYVDPINGSDASTGTVLSPLQNLFVATAWSKKGGTVVLYDGTYNPTEIVRKDLTIMGAYGTMPMITSRDASDTTGANWERAALTFRQCQGRIQNLYLTESQVGLDAYVTDNMEVTGCRISDTTTGLSFLQVPTEGAIVRATIISSTEVGVDFSGCYDPCVNSCLIYDATVGIRASDTSNIYVTGNTIDSDSTAVWLDQTCTGVISSNNLTGCDAGIYASSYTGPVISMNNNFYDTVIPYGGRPPDVDQSNISLNPLYVNQPQRDYRLTQSSLNIDAGLATYDRFMRDIQGINRAVTAPPDIGAYEFIDGTHTGDWYVSGAIWDDSTNYGGQNDPFRTLDKAMLHDGTIHVAPGHLDSYYLGLGNSPVRLDGSTATFRTHYSNVDINRIIYASPNGNDTSGDGSISNPYQTINGALADSSEGDYIVTLSGEYPEFTGIRGRTILFQPDKVLQVMDGTSRFLVDLFDQPDLRRFGIVEYEPQWSLDYTGQSMATISDGFLRLTYDGTNSVRADSTFTFERDFDISAEIRNVNDPLKFEVHNPDTTVCLSYNDGAYRADMMADGSASYCYGQLSVGPMEEKNFWTDYICLSTDDTREGWAPLSFMSFDCSSSAVNIVGGISQEYAEDYRLEGGKLVWRGLGLDGVLEPGDTVRVIYRARELSEKVRASISLHGPRMTVKVTDGQSWLTLARRNIGAGLDGQWGASFYMDSTEDSDGTCSVGKAFVSNFQGLALSFSNTDLDREMLQRTERRTVIVYRDRT